MLTKWSRDQRLLPSNAIGGGDGQRRFLERRPSLPDVSQLSRMVKSSKMRRSFSFASVEGSSKANIASSLGGDKAWWTQLFRFSKGNKHGGPVKSVPCATSTREATRTKYEERTGECFSSQLNGSKSTKAKGVEDALRQRRRSIRPDIPASHEFPAEEEVTFSFLKSISTGAPTLESSLLPNPVYQPCEVFGALSAQDGGNILITQHSEDMSAMNNTGRVTGEKIAFENKVVTGMPTCTSSEQEVISAHNSARLATHLASIHLEDAHGATRKHYGHTEMPETNVSESASGSCHDKVQRFHAVACQPVPIQQAARKPCIPAGSRCFSWKPIPSNKIQPTASPTNESFEGAMAASHSCITGEIVRKPLPRKNCIFQTDDKRPLAKVIAGVSVKYCSDDTSAPFVRYTEENVSNAAKGTPESTTKSNVASVQKYSEQPSHSGVLSIHDWQKPAVVQSSFLQVPGAYIDGLPESEAENQRPAVKYGTQSDSANNVQKPGSSTDVEDFAIIRYPFMEVAESSMQVPILDLDTRAAPCNLNKTAPAAAPSSSLGAGTGARPKSGAARVRAGTKAHKKETKHLGDLRDPRTRETYRMNMLLRPSDAGSSSVQIGSSHHKNGLFPFYEFSESDKEFIEELEQTCASTDKCNIGMEEIKWFNEERIQAHITEQNESCTLKIRELEAAHTTQLATDSRTYDEGLISSEALHTFGTEKNCKSFRESFESLEEGRGEIVDSIGKHHGVRLDSVEQIDKAWQEEEEKRLKSLLRQYKAMEEPMQCYQEAVLDYEEDDFESLLKEHLAYQKALIAMLRDEEDEIRSYEATVLEIEQMNKVLEIQEEYMDQLEAFFEVLRQYLDREDDVMDHFAEEIEILEEDVLQGPKNHEGA
ncbi:hypothetical protein HPB49_006256 [Dermacentor silvarum]|uniref:Uncharacterized protein n=1 Tax=Dermacentor silvarum TaxID=543639 RepID=A0ACB8DW62_DERSI|nr:hypothetical protein HPB49_006256 [Dermacentor silvarum]